MAVRTDQGKQVGIPTHMLQEAPPGEGYVADISLQQLQSAQELPRQNWPDQPSIAKSRQGATQAGNHPGGASDFSSLDTNQDDQISLHEAQQGAKLSENFQQFDRDPDQQLDRTEFAAFQKRQ